MVASFIAGLAIGLILGAILGVKLYKKLQSYFGIKINLKGVIDGNKG